MKSKIKKNGISIFIVLLFILGAIPILSSCKSPQQVNQTLTELSQSVRTFECQSGDFIRVRKRVENLVGKAGKLETMSSDVFSIAKIFNEILLAKCPEHLHESCITKHEYRKNQSICKQHDYFCHWEIYGPISEFGITASAKIYKDGTIKEASTTIQVHDFIEKTACFVSKLLKQEGFYNDNDSKENTNKLYDMDTDTER